MYMLSGSHIGTICVEGELCTGGGANCRGEYVGREKCLRVHGECWATNLSLNALKKCKKC